MEFKAEELAFLSWIIEGLPNDRFLQIQEDKLPKNPVLLSIIRIILQCQEFAKDLQAATQEKNILEGRSLMSGLEDLLQQSSLKTLSRYPSLLTERKEVLILLDKFHGESLEAQKDEYYAFLTLYSVIMIILESSLMRKNESDGFTTFEEVQNLVLAIISEDKRLAVLEDTFSLLFFMSNQIEQVSKMHCKNAIWIEAKEKNSGFMCKNPGLIKALLKLVEDCMEASEWVNENIKHDIRRLSQHTSELKWKLEVVKNIPICEGFPKKEYWLCELYSAKTDDSEDEITALDEKKKKKNDSTESSDTSRSCTSPEVIVKHGRRHPRRRLAANKRDEPSIVNKLLCSPTELITLCLLAGSQSQACDIVKMWNLWDTVEGQEVVFSKGFEDLRHKLISFDKSAVLRAVNSPLKFSPKGNSPGLLKGLRLAASSSLGSSAIPNLVEDLVRNGPSSEILNVIDDINHVRQFVAVDLAVSGSLHFPSVHTLLNMVDTESTEIKVNPVYLRQWFSYVQDLKYLVSKFLESRDSLDFQTPLGLPSSSSLLTRTYPKDPKAVINDFKLRVKISNLLSDLEKDAALKVQLDTLDKLAKLFPDGAVRGLAVFLRNLCDTLLPYGVDWKTLNDMIEQSPQTIICSIFLKLTEEKIQNFQNDLSNIGISLPHSLSNAVAPGLKLKECAAFCDCTKDTCEVDQKIMSYLSSENAICVYFVRLFHGMVDDVPDYLVSYANSRRRQRLTGKPVGLTVCLRAVLEKFQKLIDEGKTNDAISLAALTQPPFLEFPEVKAFLHSQKQKLGEIKEGKEKDNELFPAEGASDMVSSLPPQVQSQLKHCQDPILIYEMFLMNGLFQQISDTIVTVKGNSSIPFLKEKLDNLFLGYAEKALLIEEETIGAKSQTGMTKASSESYFVLGSSGSFQSPSKQEQESFQMPVTTPTKEEWIPDSKVRDCMCCGMITFSLFNRRHHCRRCGRVVCSSCSKHRIEVSGYGVVPVKVCNDCFQLMEEMRGNQQTNSLSRSFEHETNPQQRDEGLLTWILTGDYQHDSIVRAEFAYESAPDSQLCLNILGFVSNFLTTSMFLLNMCEKLLDSLSLKAVSDRSFLLQIIKSLILAAKVQISSESTRVYSAEDEVPDNVFKQLNNVIKSHDEISSRMEVVLLLEAAGCFHLINKKQPNFRQLRQKLIDEERWQLALEVSTKCGLDAATVWASWGIVCLRAGNLNGARSRLSKCLEPRRVSPILDEVVNVLEALAKTQRAFLSKRNNNLDDNNPHYLQSRLDRLNAICEGSLTHLLDLKEVKYSSRDRCLNEAEFYLKTYGSPESLLSFYVRHSMLSAGIQYAKKNKAPVEMFVNGFWIPACQVGCMEDLLKMIKQIDPLLEFWRDYICEVCKELRKKYFFHTAKRLYSWIGDWVQAGHACCTIYRMYSSDFKRMSQGKKLLQEAEVHFNQFLESKIAMGFTLIDDEVQAVEHALKVTKLQIEASDYIAECQEQLWKTSGSKSVLTYLSQEKKSSGSLSKRGSTLKLSEQNQRIPTLFDDEAGVKSVLEVLIMAPTVDPSRLQLAWKISAEMEVPWKPILEKCIVTLSVNRRFSELSVFVNFIRYQQRISGDSNSKLDEALMKAVKQLNADEPAIKDSELIIGLIEALSVKVLTYLSLGWLQSAYALAVRSQSVPDVRRILEECEKRNETGIQRLCCNWLALYGNR